MEHCAKMTRIKLLFVFNCWTGHRGAERQLLGLIDSLPENLHAEIFIFTNEDNKTPGLFHNGVFEWVSGSWLNRFRIIKAILLFNQCSKGDYDVLITEGLGSALFFGRICAILHRVPICYSTLHTMENLNRETARHYFEMPNNILNYIIPYFCGKRVFKYHPVTKQLEKKIRVLAKQYPVETLWNAVPVEDFRELEDYEPGTKVQAILENIRGNPTVIQVGTIDENKNHLFTLKCIREIKKDLPGIKYLIVGKGSNISALADYVKLHHLNQQVIFAGHMSKMNCLCLIKESDVLLLTSFSEGLPTVVIEAMACSVPVVSFDVGGLSDAIEHGDNGYLVPVGDLKLFNKYVLDLLKHKRTCIQMGASGYKKVMEQFTMDRKARKLVKTIKRDLKKIKSGR